MILGDDSSSQSQSQPQSPRQPLMDSKSLQQPLSPPSAHQTPSAGPAPPYYQSRQALHTHVPAHYSLQSRRYFHSPGRRFFKAFAIACLIWFVLGMFTRSVVEVARHSSLGPHLTAQSHLAGPERGDGKIDRCLKGSEWVRDQKNPPKKIDSEFYKVNTAFTLPVSADALYLLSRGRWSHGALDIQTSDDVEDVVVKVTAKYNKQDLINSASVCLLTRGDNEHGLGIFTPQEWPGERWVHSRLSWEVEVLIPSGAILPDFSTHMSIFPHHLGDLSSSVLFRKLDLRTSNAPIKIDSITADMANIQTTNSAIEGKFNTSDTLVLKTSNGPIKVDVKLNNDPARKKATSASLTTNNNVIELGASLISSAPSGVEGLFDLNAKTNNAHLHASIATAPADSTINFTGRTSNSPAKVHLHDAYEGSFAASTSNRPIILNTLNDPEDPRREGRHRKVEFDWQDKNRHQLEGSVSWGSGRKTPLGSVKIRTSNSPIDLTV